MSEKLEVNITVCIVSVRGNFGRKPRKLCFIRPTNFYSVAPFCLCRILWILIWYSSHTHFRLQRLSLFLFHHRYMNWIRVLLFSDDHDDDDYTSIYNVREEVKSLPMHFVKQENAVIFQSVTRCYSSPSSCLSLASSLFFSLLVSLFPLFS